MTVTPTATEWVRAVLSDGGWHRLGDLTVGAGMEGLTLGDLHEAWAALADDLEWNTARPQRVRLVPRTTRQLTMGGEG